MNEEQIFTDIKELTKKKIAIDFPLTAECMQMDDCKDFASDAIVLKLRSFIASERIGMKQIEYEYMVYKNWFEHFLATILPLKWYKPKTVTIKKDIKLEVEDLFSKCKIWPQLGEPIRIIRKLELEDAL